VAVDGRVSVELDDAVCRELHSLARASGRPQAELIREAIDAFVEQHDRRVITLGASAIVALKDRRDRHHRAAMSELASRSVVPVLPMAILAELDRALRLRDPANGIDAVLGSLIDGSMFLDCGDVDPPRVRELMRRYQGLELNLADAALIACGERHGGVIMAFDRRHLEEVAADGTITLVP
jgi:predicted nucleic acid-binding protein